MKKRILLLTAVATLGCCSISKADITNAWWHDDGDGAIVCTNWSFANGTLGMSGIQYGGGPAHMVGWVQTDSATDPTLTLANSVNNDTSISWIGYEVNLIMSGPFTFVGSPSVDNPPDDDWYLVGEEQPTLQATGPYAGDYEGTLYFNAGTPVGIGGELDYSYSIQFSGSTFYSFTEQAFAYETEVPEPGTLALMGMGGLMLALRQRRNRRQGA